ncbi:hypothetical protein SAMN05444157_2913 [Frankineae bacterium MT45]|nr:hypothetical protein SAMN05444157_2913 [Frankineae bacterium MT45]
MCLSCFCRWARAAASSDDAGNFFGVVSYAGWSDRRMRFFPAIVLTSGGCPFRYCNVAANRREPISIWRVLVKRTYLFRTYRAIGMAVMPIGAIFAAISTPGSASASTTAAVVPESAPVNDTSVISLAKERNISVATAAAQIGVQHAGVLEIPEVAKYFGNRFAGVWFDANSRMHIAVASSSTMRAVSVPAIPGIMAHQLSDVTDLNIVHWSEGDLEAVTVALSPYIPRINKGMPVSVTLQTVPSENAVEIVTGTGGLSAHQRTFIANARSRFGSRIIVKTVAGSNRASLDSCDTPQSCDPPLRAGLRILSNGYGCTSGPIVRSNVDNALFVLTAGHCLDDAAGQPWTETFTNGENHLIGTGWSNGPGVTGSDDEGIISINNPTGWTPRAEILVQAGANTTFSPGYPVSGTGTSVVGMRVCKAGAYYGTTCGTVVAVNATGPSGITGMGEASYLGGSGDSGAPIFSGGIVYGIHESHYSPTGAPSSTTSYYVGITRATTVLHVHVATGN